MTRADKHDKALVPKLRFPEFRDADEWDYKPLHNLADKQTRKNNDKERERVLTNSAEFGVIDQREYFDKDIADKNNLNGYTLIDRGDFVYNPRISSIAPVGPISKNKVGDGVMSPLYTVVRFHSDENTFFEKYFNSSHWHRYLKQVSNTGARHDRMSIASDDFMAMPLPSPEPAEQQKIADCLTSLDERIQATGARIDALKAHKKGLMQQLFPTDGATTPQRRFPEFRYAGEWHFGQLNDLLESIGNGLSLTQNIDKRGVKVTRIETISEGTINDEKVGYLETIRDIQAYRLKSGDILFSNINSLSHIGKTAFVEVSNDLYHGMNLLRLIVNRNDNVAKFVFFFLNTDVARSSIRSRANKAINQASINQTELGKTDVAFPPKAEQQKIADCLSSLDELIAATTAQRDALGQHKKGLMQQLFPAFDEDAA